VARSGRPVPPARRAEPATASRRDGGRPAAVKERRRSRGGAIARRLLWSVLLLGVVAVAVAIGVNFLLSTANHTIVHYRHVVANDAQQAINQVQAIVNQYTK